MAKKCAFAGCWIRIVASLQTSRFARSLVGMSCLLCLAAQSAPEAPPASNEIVVTGRKATDEEIRRQAASHIRALGVANGQRAVARWIDPICPKVLGLSPAHGLIVETRILAIAKSLEIDAEQSPCDSNIVIAFVSGAPAITRLISSRQHRQFGEVPVAQRSAVLSGGAPIRWWHLTELRGRDGHRTVSFTPPSVQLEGGGSLPSGPDTAILSQYGSSIVSTQTVRALRSAVIIVDVDRAEGAALGSIADYAALVGLAEIRLGGETPPRSILSLFKKEQAVRLTEWDRSFLLELYRLPLDRLARYQRGRLVRAIVDDQPQRLSSDGE